MVPLGFVVDVLGRRLAELSWSGPCVCVFVCAPPRPAARAQSEIECGVIAASSDGGVGDGQRLRMMVMVRKGAVVSMRTVSQAPRPNQTSSYSYPSKAAPVIPLGWQRGKWQSSGASHVLPAAPPRVGRKSSTETTPPSARAPLSLFQFSSFLQSASRTHLPTAIQDLAAR